jgi:uncharacterized alkaline shock family protein YloU
MGPFDRGLLLLYSLCFTVILGLLLLMYAGWTPALQLAENVFTPERQVIFIAAGIVLFVAGLRLILTSIIPRKRMEKVAVIEDNPLGQVRIALTAVESLVSKVVGNFNGVREVRPKVLTQTDGIAIQVKLVTAPSISIPEVSQEIQQQVKDKVLEVTGITVNNIRVVVENITTAKPRVE